MNRRERHIHILKRCKSVLGSLGYEVLTDQEIEQFARNALWWRGLARHNARVMTKWVMQDFEHGYYS